MLCKKTAVLPTALILLLFLGLLGCSDTETPQLVGLSDTVFQFKADNLISFTIKNDNEMYASTWGGSIGLYTSDGELLSIYPRTENIIHLTYIDSLIFGYDMVEESVVEIDLSNQSVRTIASLVIDELRSFTVVDDVIIMIVVESYNYVNFFTLENDGYVNYNEKLLILDINSGVITESDAIKNPIAMYYSSTNELYICARPDDLYIIYSFNINNGRATPVKLLADSVYFQFFALENDHLIYAAVSGDVMVRRLSDDFEYVAVSYSENTGLFLLGGGFVYNEGYVYFIEQRAKSGDIDAMHAHDENYNHDEDFPVTTLLQALRTDLEYISLKRSHSEDVYDYENVEDIVVISAPHWNRLFSLEAIEHRSGIRSTYTGQSFDDYTQFILSIMTGDENVDIYILSLGETTLVMRDQQVYASLYGSQIIRDYLDGCFEWIRDISYTSDGDLWMLPLDFATNALWYVPDNFSRFDLSYDDVSSLSDYIQTVERLNELKGNYTTFCTYFAYPSMLWSDQYEMTHNDYDNGFVKFDTSVYRQYFDMIWTGWSRYGNPATQVTSHPILDYDFDLIWESEDSRYDGMFADYDIDRVIFKLDMIDNVLANTGSGNPKYGNLADWRVLPSPRISDEVNRNYGYLTFAVVNPFSKNREQAVAFLEAAATDMLSVITKPVFFHKEMSAYDGFYDMSLGVYQDIFSIYEESAAIGKVFGLFGIHNTQSVIDDYQSGKISLQDAIDEIQRKAEFWLNE